jgi:hypothetical protein
MYYTDFQRDEFEAEQKFRQKMRDEAFDVMEQSTYLQLKPKFDYEELATEHKQYNINDVFSLIDNMNEILDNNSYSNSQKVETIKERYNTLQKITTKLIKTGVITSTDNQVAFYLSQFPKLQNFIKKYITSVDIKSLEFEEGDSELRIRKLKTLNDGLLQELETNKNKLMKWIYKKNKDILDNNALILRSKYISFEILNRIFNNLQQVEKSIINGINKKKPLPVEMLDVKETIPQSVIDALDLNPKAPPAKPSASIWAKKAKEREEKHLEEKMAELQLDDTDKPPLDDEDEEDIDEPIIPDDRPPEPPSPTFRRVRRDEKTTTSTSASTKKNNGESTGRPAPLED